MNDEEDVYVTGFYHFDLAFVASHTSSEVTMIGKAKMATSV